MKKALLIIMIVMGFVACGRKYKIYSLQEKKAMYHKAYIEGDLKTQDKIESQMRFIEEAIAKGDKKAQEEAYEWASVVIGM